MSCSSENMMPTATIVRGSRRPRSCGSLGSGPTALVVGRCTRGACLAVVALVLLGDDTSARSFLGGGNKCSAGFSWRRKSNSQGYRRPRYAWQLFAPRQKASSSSNRARRNAALHPSQAALTSAADAQRDGRLLPVGTGGTGSAVVSPAQLYRVSRSRGNEQGQQALAFEADEAAARDLLRSPRSAAAVGEDERDYPERLTAYAAQSVVETPAAANDIEVITATTGTGGSNGRPDLPVLSEDDLMQLHAGQRVQQQTRDGGAGSGTVVVDVRADSDVVLGLLTKYEDYADMIDTVRECEVFPEEGRDKRKVEVTVSRFRLHIRVVMSLLRDRNMVQFELDPDCTKAGRAVLREATGFFYVESPPDRPGFSRVWMSASVDVNRFVPGVIVDYAAGRALPRASSWIKPTCEAAQRRKVRALAAKGTAPP